METVKNKRLEINVYELVMFCLKRLQIVLSTGFIAASICFAYTVFLVEPEYTSVTKIYVLNRQTDESITSSDLQSSTYLTKDYTELIKSRKVLEVVIAELGLETSYEALLEKVTVGTQSDTRVVSISVVDKDPYEASEIANEIRNVGAAHIQSVMNAVAVNVVDEANIPAWTSNNNMKKYVVLAFVGGCVLALLCLSIQFVLDDKVTTAGDVEKYLGLSVLGVFPIDEELVKRKQRDKRRKRVSRRAAR
jgi:capsular polysaccharide biosynthesis protein